MVLEFQPNDKRFKAIWATFSTFSLKPNIENYNRPFRRIVFFVLCASDVNIVLYILSMVREVEFL